MAYWLLKTEPDDFSWSDQIARGKKGESWTGVRNAQARNFMRDMKKGDLAFFYHTGGEKMIVGVVTVVREAYQDPTSGDPRWLAVDVVAAESLPAPVTLAAIKDEPRLADMALVKNSRLSVQPVTSSEWSLVRRLGGL